MTFDEALRTDEVRLDGKKAKRLQRVTEILDRVRALAKIRAIFV
ncbi:MAG: hypothetical protein R3A47_07745 [Polyangiales bacterium]